MREASIETLKTVVNVITGGIKLAIAGVLLIIVGIAAIFATINWPFYSYTQMHSFVSEVKKDYPAEAKFISPELKVESDDEFLTMGKFYCAMKFINHHVLLMDVTSDNKSDPKYQKFTASVYLNADQHLCPRKLPVVATR